MSFGFSVGDFLTAATLIQNLISSLRGSSVVEYRELILELRGLERALYEIEHLKCVPGQEVAINSIKVAALICQHPLDEFARKLKQFEGLGEMANRKLGTTERLLLWKKKLSWGFRMEDEVTRLRAYLIVHIGSLNMRLMTQGLTTVSVAAKRAGDEQEVLTTRLDASRTIIAETQKKVDKLGFVGSGISSILEKLLGIISRDIVSQLKNILDLASKVWQSNIQIMDVVTKIQNSPQMLDLRFTWVQEPVRFEDALGRIIPIPSEFNWSKLELIIQDQFRTGPGNLKVAAGEYELSNTFDSMQAISQSSFEGLMPGMSITMAIIIGQYGEGPIQCCLKPGCRSFKMVSNEAGGKNCGTCKTWFDQASRSLPRPYRPLDPRLVELDDDYVEVRGEKRKIEGTIDVRESKAQIAGIHKKMRTERRTFKNLRVCFTKLPESPTVSNVRGKQQGAVQKRRRRRSLTNSQNSIVDKVPILSTRVTGYTLILPPR